VKENHRGKQIGGRLFEYLKTFAKLNKKHLLMEIDDPEFGDDKVQRLKRIAFYQKNGALWLEDIKYILPALDGTYPTEQILMLVPENSKSEFSGEKIKDLVKRLYDELYGISGEDTYLAKIITSITEKVRVLPFL
jgi:hypothetical protein